MVKKIEKKSKKLVKKNILKKRIKKTKSFGILAIICGLIGVIILIIIAFPGIVSSLLTKDEPVLGVTAQVSSSGVYTVNEDDLAMFSTLIYENATRKDASGNETSFARCSATNSNYSDLKYKSCMLSSEDGKRDHMYAPADIIGVKSKKLKDYLDNDYTSKDAIGAVASIAMTSVLKEDSEPFYFSNTATTDPDYSQNLNNWDVVDFYDAPAANRLSTAHYGKITASTFKKDNNIVISFRGTDLTDIFDWLQDVSYGIKNDSGQDNLAATYAKSIADIYAGKKDPKTGLDYNIYLTGHSLGGYLAQIAAANLIDIDSNNNITNSRNLRRVVYFNGMGLFFSSKAASNPINSQIAVKKKLQAFNPQNNGVVGDKIELVRIYGDPVSSIGVHLGKIKTFHASKDIAAKHKKQFNLTIAKTFQQLINENGLNKNISDKVKANLGNLNSKPSILSGTNFGFLVNTNPNTSTLNFIFNNLLGLNIDTSLFSGAFKEYNTQGLLSYVMTAHETDSFFYTDYYYQMNKNNSSNNYVTPNIFTNEIIQNPSLDKSYIRTSLSDNRLDDAVVIADYGPVCDFAFSKTALFTNENFSGTISCYDPSGFKDSSISRIMNIQIPDVINKVSIGSVSNPTRSNDGKTYTWTLNNLKTVGIWSGAPLLTKGTYDTYVCLTGNAVSNMNGTYNRRQCSSVISVTKK